MKTLKEYLTESKKVYSFKIKVAGELPESFQENLKTSLERCKVAKLEKISTTPIQSLPLDFPTMSNCEVHIFEVTCEDVDGDLEHTIEDLKESSGGLKSIRNFDTTAVFLKMLGVRAEHGAR